MHAVVIVSVYGGCGVVILCWCVACAVVMMGGHWRID